MTDENRLTAENPAPRFRAVRGVPLQGERAPGQSSFRMNDVRYVVGRLCEADRLNGAHDGCTIANSHSVRLDVQSDANNSGVANLTIKVNNVTRQQGVNATIARVLVPIEVFRLATATAEVEVEEEVDAAAHLLNIVRSALLTSARDNRCFEIVQA